LETTDLGAASPAALALGWHTLEALAARHIASWFDPAMSEAQQATLRAGWRKAVSRASHWENGEGEET